MITDSNYKFKVCLSLENFNNKIICNDFLHGNYKIHGANRGISYKETEIISVELCDKLIHGHVFCQCMQPKDYWKDGKFHKDFRKDGSFGTGQKINIHFKEAYLMCIDVDDEDNYISIQDYVSKLRFKPTFYYTTYNHKQPGKGLRFRIVYVLDKPITGHYLYYRYCNYKLNCLIEEDTKSIIKDKCNLSAAQYFNGTYIDNPEFNVEYEISDIIYSLSDFDIYSDTSEDYVEFLKNKAAYSDSAYLDNRLEIESELFRIKPEQKVEKIEEIDIFSENFVITESIKATGISQSFIKDMKTMSYKDFMNKYHYTLIYRIEPDYWYDLKIDDTNYKWQNIPDNYFELPFYVKDYKPKNGQRRRWKLSDRMCLRRIIKPSISATELLYNAYFDLHNFINNTDGTDIITIDDLIIRVYKAMNKDIKDLREIFKDKIIELQKDNPKYEYGIIFGSGIKNYKTALHHWLINQFDMLYDSNKTFKENLNYINQVFKNENRKPIGERILRQYKHDLEPNNKLTGKELKSKIDFNKGIKWNLNQLRSKGYKVNEKEVTELINKRKKQREKRLKNKISIQSSKEERQSNIYIC